MIADVASITQPDHRLICQALVGRVPGVESIVLVGSRALPWESTALKKSDYDIIVVLKLLALPFALRSLKSVERELGTQLGVSVTINPLLKWQARRAKGNLFLYKLKRQAVVLYGMDPRDYIDAGSLADVRIGKFFSYYFSTVKKFLEVQPPVLVNGNLTHEETLQTVYLLAKVILQVAELVVMVHGHFPATPGELLRYLQDLSEQAGRLGPDFRQDAILALQVREQRTVYDWLPLWSRTRSYLIATLELLGERCKPGPLSAAQVLQDLEQYRLNTRAANFQYFVLRLLFQFEIAWKSLMSKVPITDLVWKSAGWLLLAAEADRIRDDMMANAKQEIATFIDAPVLKRTSVSTDWVLYRDVVLRQWPFACTVIGVW